MIFKNESNDRRQDVLMKRLIDENIESIENMHPDDVNEFRLEFDGGITKDGIAFCITTRVDANNYYIFSGGGKSMNLRIRKLMPKECFKLQGVKASDSKRITDNTSDRNAYKLAGDSISTCNLMMIFGQLFDVEWEKKIRELTEDLVNDR